MSNNKKKYEPTSGGYKEVDAADKDVAAITEGVTPEKKVSATQQEANSKGKKGKKGAKSKGGNSEAEAISDENLALETNRHIPYPELGGHTVAQLSGMETHKRKSILASKDDEFVSKYM